MNVTFRQLRLFLALAETGSVSGAARAMHVTQPTASMQLKEVANAVGLPLYEVVGRRLHLTEAGRELARTARAIAGEWDVFEQHVAITQQRHDNEPDDLALAEDRLVDVVDELGEGVREPVGLFLRH